MAREETKEMADQLFNSVIKWYNQGVNQFLLEFVKELNEFYFEENRRNMAEEEQLAALTPNQTKVLSYMKKKADEIRGTDIENNAPDSLMSYDKQRKVKEFTDLIVKITDPQNSKLSEKDKYVILKAAHEALLHEENEISLARFEKDFVDVLLKDGSISQETAFNLRQVCQVAFDESERSRRPFAMDMLPVYGEYSQTICNNVMKAMKQEFVIDGHGINVEGNKDVSFILVPRSRDAEMVRTLIERENIKLAKCNLLLADSISLLAELEGDQVKMMEGLNAAEAEKLYEIAFKNTVPCNIDRVESLEGPDTYTVRFLGKNSEYMNKLVTDAIVQTNGFSKEAGITDKMAHNMQAREQVMEFVTGIGESEKSDDFAYLIDLQQSGTSEEFENAAHRLFITKDSFTETINGKDYTVRRSDDPKGFEHSLDKAVRNFSPHMVFVSKEQAKEMELNQRHFTYTPQLIDYLHSFAVKGVTQETRQAAEYEQEFMKWAIKQSKEKDSRNILIDIADHYKDYVKDFTRQARFEADKLYRANPERTDYRKPDAEIQKLADARYQAITDRHNALMQDHGKVLESHLREMVDKMSQDRDLSERPGNEHDSRRYLNDEPLSHGLIESNRLVEERYREQAESYLTNLRESKPNNTIRNTSDLTKMDRQKLAEYRMTRASIYHQKNPTLGKDDLRIEKASFKDVMRKDLDNMIRYRQEPVYHGSLDVYRKINDVITGRISAEELGIDRKTLKDAELTWNIQGKEVAELTNEELTKHIDDIEKIGDALIQKHNDVEEIAVVKIEERISAVLKEKDMDYSLRSSDVMRIYEDVNRDIVDARWNMDRQGLTGMSQRDLQQHWPDIVDIIDKEAGDFVQEMDRDRFDRDERGDEIEFS